MDHDKCSFVLTLIVLGLCKVSYQKKALKCKEVSDSVIEVGRDETEEDLKKHEKEMEKELNRKPINWKAVEQLQKITFSSRWDAVSQIIGKNSVEKVLEQYPYLDHERVVSNSSLLTIIIINCSGCV